MPTTALESSTICWRIAFQLLDNPELDYQATAEAIWGPGLNKTVAKNRVNGHVTRLRQLGIARSLGSNLFEINAIRLAEVSKIPLEARDVR